jgi:hypothetical protein
MNLRVTRILCSILALAGCSSQNPAKVAPANSSAGQPQTSSAAAPVATSVLQRDGCTIDLAKVCQSYIDQPQFTYNGEEYDWPRFQQNSVRHPDVEIWARYPDGSVVADVECHVDAQNRKINWARLLPNPPLTDKSWDFAKSKEWCQQDFPDYSAWGQYWPSGISNE